MRGRPFELGNTFGQGRPPGSPNKKGLMLQRLLLERGEEIRSRHGGRPCGACSVLERLIPRLKDVAELPEDSLSTTNQDVQKILRGLTDEELNLLERIARKARVLEAESNDGRAQGPEPAQDQPAIPGDGSAAA